MNVNIRDLDGHIATVLVDPTDTVSFLMLKISDAFGTDSTEQRLIYRGAQLVPDTTLSFYNIQEGDTINVVKKLNRTMTLYLKERAPGTREWTLDYDFEKEEDSVIHLVAKFIRNAGCRRVEFYNSGVRMYTDQKLSMFKDLDKGIEVVIKA